MKISDWKYIERIEQHIDEYSSGTKDAIETLLFIAKIIKEYDDSEQ